MTYIRTRDYLSQTTVAVCCARLPSGLSPTWLWRCYLWRSLRGGCWTSWPAPATHWASPCLTPSMHSGWPKTGTGACISTRLHPRYGCLRAGCRLLVLHSMLGLDLHAFQPVVDWPHVCCSHNVAAGHCRACCAALWCFLQAACVCEAPVRAGFV